MLILPNEDPKSHLVTKLKHLFKMNSVKYGLWGCLFGACFPAISLILVAYENGVSLGEAISEHHSMLLFVIYTAPVFLGILAYIAGAKQDDIEELYQLKSRKDLEEKNAQLFAAEKIGRFGSWNWNIESKAMKWTDGFYVICDLSHEKCKPSFECLIGTIHPEDRERVKSELESGMRLPRKLSFEYRLSSQVPSLRWVKSLVVVVVNDQGVPTQLIGTVQDITEKKYQDELIVEQQDALLQSAKMSALGEMASGVAHEINNPLTIIQLRTDQLEERAKENNLEAAFVINAVSSIRGTVERIAKIVHGLRVFARDGKRDVMAPTPVLSIIKDTFSFCSDRFVNHGVQLDFEVKSENPELVQIECRPIEIAQVLLNLLVNSFDAIQELPDKWVKVEIIEVGEYVSLSVIDSGSGIPKDVQAKMMQPFFTTKGIGKGTGLGLSISRGIIMSHNGKIYVDEFSKNTKITMVLPKKQSTVRKKKKAMAA
jgi:signal transduction histidine kinase